MLKEALSCGGIRFMASMDAGNYGAYLEGDKDWKGLLRVISVHDVTLPNRL